MNSKAHENSDLKKGATEDTEPGGESRPGLAHNRLAGQLPHRETDPMIKDADSDFPEPGSNPEHS
jgi:hypothetical protein